MALCQIGNIGVSEPAGSLMSFNKSAFPFEAFVVGLLYKADCWILDGEEVGEFCCMSRWR